MNNDRELFHQALQRQNERAARMKMPDDMEQRVMESIGYRRHHAWLYPAIAASIVVALFIGSSLFRTEDDTNVCYTVENGQRITDRNIVMSHVETTLCDIFTTDK